MGPFYSCDKSNNDDIISSWSHTVLFLYQYISISLVMCQSRKPHIAIKKSLPQWILGMTISSIFSIAYLLIPVYLLSAIAALIMRYPSTNSSISYALPMLISIVVPPQPSLFVLRLLRPMLDYFDFETIHLDEKNIRSNMANGTNYLFAAQPHGVLSFVGMCAAVDRPEDTKLVPTAAASVVLQIPILKHLMGIFNLVDASASSIKRILNKGGSVLIYIGGIAELFKSCRTEERLYLAKRKGFIKLALREGVDVVPVYLFGNTSTEMKRCRFCVGIENSTHSSYTFSTSCRNDKPT